MSKKEKQWRNGATAKAENNVKMAYRNESGRRRNNNVEISIMKYRMKAVISKMKYRRMKRKHHMVMKKAK
jgi:division protein CdvB (Snf7/Vps24/ESCRT-III family)